MGFFHSIVHHISHATSVVTKPFHSVVNHVLPPVQHAFSGGFQKVSKPINSIVKHIAPVSKQIGKAVVATAKTVYKDGKDFANNNSPGHFFDKAEGGIEKLGQTIFNNPMTYIALVGGAYVMMQSRK